ncbi:hypothetical protein ACFUTX_14665 [Microbacterium sp. NPDC057407]|uniref:hypothetical protein n=1 Tax=Microbacterium sp. NPDC057407 TaxID=3346120 RepID=UPI00366AF3B3
MTDQTAPAPGAPATPTSHRGLAVAAAILGVSTVATLAIGWALAANAAGMEGLGIAVMTLFAITIVGVVSLTVGIFAVVLSRPRWPAVVGLVLTVAPLLFVAAQFVPWSSLRG